MNGIIEVTGLKKSFGKTEALKGVDLSLQQGELFGYLGPNGAGKSTTIRILTGLTVKSGGSASLGGYDITKQALQAKRQFGVVHQYINLDMELTVFENLDLHGRLFGMEKKKRQQRIDELLEYAEMAERANDLVKKLSGGLKRRISIIRALLHQPSILFLDEPTTGLDPSIRRRIWALIKRIQKEGTTIFLTTHHIEEAEFLADRVAFIDLGEIVALDSPAKLMQSVGVWAIDQLRDGSMQTHYFSSKEEAANFKADEGFTLRRVNLEDAFLQITGKKVQ